MRRVLVPVITLVFLVCLAACGTERISQPEAPRIDLTPSATLLVDEAGLRFDPEPVPAPLTVPAGTLIEVRNAGSADHRVQGSTGSVAFDTGIMHPGDSTKVLLFKPGDMSVRDLNAPDHAITITVTKAAGP